MGEGSLECFLGYFLLWTGTSLSIWGAVERTLDLEGGSDATSMHVALGK